MEDTLKLILSKLESLEAGQNATNKRLDNMQADMEQIKEDTALTREVVNGLSEWVEVASDVLRIKYPVKE